MCSFCQYKWPVQDKWTWLMSVQMTCAGKMGVAYVSTNNLWRIDGRAYISATDLDNAQQAQRHFTDVICSDFISQFCFKLYTLSPFVCWHFIMIIYRNHCNVLVRLPSLNGFVDTSGRKECSNIFLYYYTLKLWRKFFFIIKH